MTRYELNELLILAGKLAQSEIERLDAQEPVFARWRRLRALERAEAALTANERLIAA